MLLLLLLLLNTEQRKCSLSSWLEDQLLLNMRTKGESFSWAHALLLTEVCEVAEVHGKEGSSEGKLGDKPGLQGGNCLHLQRSEVGQILQARCVITLLEGSKLSMYKSVKHQKTNP